MSAITQAFYQRLAGDIELVRLLGTYDGGPAIFTADPAPIDAELPYIVTAGETAQTAFDTKTTRGRTVLREVRCFASADGSTDPIEAIAERVRVLFHRHKLAIDGFATSVADASGPIKPDETDPAANPDAYVRIVTVRLVIEEAA